MTDKPTEATAEDVEYIVQVAELMVGGEDPEDRRWRDVATVKVPPRTKRPSVIQKGLEQAGIEVTLEIKARALDLPNAHVYTPEPPPPAPPLRFT